VKTDQYILVRLTFNESNKFHQNENQLNSSHQTKSNLFGHFVWVYTLSIFVSARFFANQDKWFTITLNGIRYYINFGQSLTDDQKK